MTGTPVLRRDTSRRLVAEFAGTSLLLVAVVGSGIATSVDGAASTQLFQHAAVVGATLVVLILAFGPVSGAHLNPAVTLATVLLHALPRNLALPYVLVQVTGAITGTITANVMFGLDPVAFGTTARTGGALWGSEVVATAGLVAVIFGLARAGNDRAVPGAVGAWIFGAVFFTSSMCFANPAVSVARLFTSSWTAILPAHVPAYVLAQLVATGLAVLGVRWLWLPESDHRHVPVAPTTDSTPDPIPAPGRTGRPHAQPRRVMSSPSSRGRLSPWATSFAPPTTIGTPMIPEPTTPDAASTGVPTVLFLCVHNAGRSQMAMGWMRHLGGDRIEVRSGGSDPGDAVNPSAVAAMAEVGVDISDAHPKPWTDQTLGEADVIVTMGCGDTCPVYPGTQYLDWALEDPAGQGVAEVRPVRDQIEQRVRALMVDLGVAPLD